MELTDIKTLYIFTDWYVPGYRAGGPIQSVFNLTSLLSKHFKIKIITRNIDYGSNEPYKDIIPDQWTFISHQHEVLYLSAGNISVKTIKNLCKSGQHDIVLINGLFSLYFSVLPLFFANFYNIKRTFVAVRGMLHKSALNVKPVKKQFFLAFARGFGLYRKVTLLSTSVYENEEILKTLGSVKISLAPNIPVFPLENEEGLSGSFKSEKGELRLLFLGRISPEKNPLSVVSALKDIDYPVQIKFVGAGIDGNYRQLFEDALKQLPVNIKWEWVKELPHPQILELFSQTDVMILPSLGENFGHAIFESFANATPVIIGNNTPWKGIEKSNGGIEVEPNDNQAIMDAINFFNAMPLENYLEWQEGALGKAIDYFESHKFEFIYRDIFTK